MPGKFVKKAVYWTVPTGIRRLVQLCIEQSSALFKAGLNLEEEALLKKNRGLRNRHLGQRCFILATGPSVKKQNLKLLRNETCIAVSNFFVHPDYAVIKPQYYCIAPYHEPITEEAFQCWLREMGPGTGDAVVFFGLSDKEKIQRNGYFAGRKVHYLNFGEPLDKTIAHVDLVHSMPPPQSVSVMALTTAIYMGFREIYLMGCEHDSILHLNVSTHFYDEKQHAMVRKGYDEWFEEDLEAYYRAHARLWQQFKALRRIAKSRFINIYNATIGGLLDVFPRINYESLFCGQSATRSTHEKLENR